MFLLSLQQWKAGLEMKDSFFFLLVKGALEQKLGESALENFAYWNEQHSVQIQISVKKRIQSSRFECSFPKKPTLLRKDSFFHVSSLKTGAKMHSALDPKCNESSVEILRILRNFWITKFKETLKINHIIWAFKVSNNFKAFYAVTPNKSFGNVSQRLGKFKTVSQREKGQG